MEYEYRFGPKLSKVKFPKAFDSYKRPKNHKGQIFGAIIRSGTNKYLLVKGKESGKYSFPKGHIEPNETPLNCIIRELYEETGITLDETIRVKTIIKPKIGTYIYCETSLELPLSPKDINEIEEAGWYDRNTIRTLNLNADAHETLMML
jgi:8-oxo-dGTP pyrophosphatase MutT (NUDIX family)